MRCAGPLALAAIAANPLDGACELVLAEHRSQRELLTMPLDAATPRFEVVFDHSVLGTSVTDHYEPRLLGGVWRSHLVAEQFQGEGYGLPHAAAEGERLVSDGPGWRLVLDRVVEPLVLRPLPAQRMRIRVGIRELELHELTGVAMELRVKACSILRKDS